MKKLNVILDETTIINFVFFRKLLVRYKYTSLIVPIVIFLGFLYIYKSQNDIYLQAKSFKNISNDSDSPVMSIAKIIGENQRGITAEEVLAIPKSIDFHRTLGEIFYESGEFEKFNYNLLTSKKQISSKYIFAKCDDDRDCIIKEISNRLPAFFEINLDPIISKRFKVNVKTLDNWSTEFLLTKIELAIQRTRLEQIKHVLHEQRSVTTDLLNDRKKELVGHSSKEVNKNFSNLNERNDFLTDRIENLSKYYNLKKSELFLIESRAKENKSVVSKNKGQKNNANFKKSRALNSKIEKLRQDISAIEVSLIDLSTDDKQIISQLKSELLNAENQLKAIPNYKKYLSNTAEFVKDSGNKANSLKFEVSVKREQFRRISSELESLKAEKKFVANELKSMEQKTKDMAPDLEYIRLLENKLVQLQLLESTVVSDLVFSKNVSDVRAFKRTSKGKIVLFSFVVTFFLLFSIVIIRYLADTKIYDEYELKKNFESVEVIGKTPDFN